MRTQITCNLHSFGMIMNDSHPVFCWFQFWPTAHFRHQRRPWLCRCCSPTGAEHLRFELLIKIHVGLRNYYWYRHHRLLEKTQFESKDFDNDFVFFGLPSILCCWGSSFWTKAQFCTDEHGKRWSDIFGVEAKTQNALHLYLVWDALLLPCPKHAKSKSHIDSSGPLAAVRVTAHDLLPEQHRHGSPSWASAFGTKRVESWDP